MTETSPAERDDDISAWLEHEVTLAVEARGLCSSPAASDALAIANIVLLQASSIQAPLTLRGFNGARRDLRQRRRAALVALGSRQLVTFDELQRPSEFEVSPGIAMQKVLCRPRARREMECEVLVVQKRIARAQALEVRRIWRRNLWRCETALGRRLLEEDHEMMRNGWSSVLTESEIADDDRLLGMRCRVLRSRPGTTREHREKVAVDTARLIVERYARLSPK